MQSIFPDAFLTAYNMFLTTFPIVVYAFSEKDIMPIEEFDGSQFKDFIPSLYFAGQRNLLYNFYITLLWLVVAFI
jgi:hypothetical protein